MRGIVITELIHEVAARELVSRLLTPGTHEQNKADADDCREKPLAFKLDD
jgi:hypothetical protein